MLHDTMFFCEMCTSYKGLCLIPTYIVDDEVLYLFVYGTFLVLRCEVFTRYKSEVLSCFVCVHETNVANRRILSMTLAVIQTLITLAIPPPPVGRISP